MIPPNVGAAAASPAAGGVGSADGTSPVGSTAGAGGERVALPVQHILSEEMQRLLEQYKQILAAPVAPPATGGNNETLWGSVDEGAGGAASSAAPLVLSPMQRAVLTSMQTDPGMQQLLPYLTQHIGAEVAAGLRHLPRLHMVLRILQALLLNPAVQLEPYLGALMPPLLTCLMAKSLGPSPAADHWALRDAAAVLLARLCNRFGEPYYSLQVKVSKQLLRTLLDGSKPLPSHYGAIVGLAALGHNTVRLLLLPQLEPYITALRPSLGEREGPGAGDKDEPGQRREGLRLYEARRVAGALTAAASAAVYDRLLTAASEGLPLQLFRAMGRARGGLMALKGNKAGDAAGSAPSALGAVTQAALPAPQPLGYTPVPTPPSDPRLDAVWAHLVSRNGSVQATVDSIAANPSDPDTVTKLVSLRSLASDPSRKGHDQTSRAVPPSRNPRDILAESWREDADLGDTVWALGELLGPGFTARLPQPSWLASINL
ncbi:hypothetical protein GPECTOR_6g569 [Gonium pectorale]|uniref:TAF6 C-terminal HEAT repeat domain-containing protein n=1 Tax=Gonium pectorale TaxID=33097 RepID=A0A150GVC4_GONPE|nr:hypothetical protein GPECTOR_6g569 [Gonium pectorale]|eukprot:KXZ53652.1 hypothetical protein GPECTOR_6g569 [Gonium pectorale]